MQPGRALKPAHGNERLTVLLLLLDAGRGYSAFLKRKKAAAPFTGGVATALPFT